ncbi:MAG TPA: sulfotransferase [Devosia sp.]|nr:sulfotransferase [Devosia sp.]
MTLEIIGAGFGRTGTSSLKIALEHLELGPAHHMFEVRDNTEAQLPLWEAVAAGGQPDWDQIFAGYRAQVDWPGARYWRELAEAYPEAKVILTVRDPDEWFDSVSATILPFLAGRADHPAPVRRIAEMADRVVNHGVFGGRMSDRAHAIRVFRDHIAAVKEEIDPARLLVLDMREGWSALCTFLAKPVPAITFPRLNSSRQFNDEEWKRA